MLLASNPTAQVAAYREEIDAAIRRVLDSGRYILGEEVAAFEREFAAYCGAAHAVGAGSGTEALHLALAALDVGPGAEVITVSHTAVATVSAIELTGATPVLVDVEPESYTVDPALVARAMTPRTKAVIAVHLYGHPAPIEALRAIAGPRGVPIVEDCAQAHGATIGGRKVGGLTEIAAFSFYPTKNLGAVGDGGAVTTNDPALAQRVRELHEYGWRERYISATSGWNSRLDEIQAAILRVKLARLDADNERRRTLARLYDGELRGTSVIPPILSDDDVYHLYVVRTDRRDELQQHLRSRGIGAAIHYPVPIHLQPAYRHGKASVPFPMPHTERAALEVLSLPMYPELTGDDVRHVASQVRGFPPTTRPGAAESST